MAKRLSLREEVLSKATRIKRTPSWCDRLPDDLRQELLAIRDEFQAGQMGDMAMGELARGIIASMQDRGHSMPKPRQVVLWLGGR
jgi:hypothetical protein